MKDKYTNKLSIAYHEAGHAVITWALGVPLHHIKVGDFEGKVIGGTAAEYFYDADTMSDFDWSKIKNKALILLSGREAERAYHELHELEFDELLSSHYDRNELADLLKKFGESNSPPIDMSTKTLGKQAYDLVTRHWDQIEVLAKKLMINGSMKGDEAKRIIESGEL